MYRAVMLDLSECAAPTGLIGNVVSIPHSGRFAIQFSVTDCTPPAIDFLSTAISATEDTITLPSHGLSTGSRIQLTCVGNPGGLSTSVRYYAIVVDQDTIKLANTYANAIANVVRDLTSSAPAGTHTFTPQTLTFYPSCYASNDGVNFVSLNISLTITTTGTYMIIPSVNAGFSYIQLYAYNNGGYGSLTASAIVTVPDKAT